MNVRTDGILAELPPILPFDEWIKLSEEEHGRRRAQTKYVQEVIEELQAGYAEYARLEKEYIGVLRRCIAVLENDMIALDGSRSRLT